MTGARARRALRVFVCPDARRPTAIRMGLLATASLVLPAVRAQPGLGSFVGSKVGAAARFRPAPTAPGEVVR